MRVRDSTPSYIGISKAGKRWKGYEGILRIIKKIVSCLLEDYIMRPVIPIILSDIFIFFINDNGDRLKVATGLHDDI